MIINIANRPHKILESLDASGISFYITGSRFFRPEKVTKFTDWDFYVSESFNRSMGLENFLAGIKFEWEGSNYHGTLPDYNCASVWTFNDGQIKVDIQIVKDATLKTYAQNIILESGALRIPMVKSCAKSVWIAVYAAINICTTPYTNKIIRSKDA